MKTLANHNTSKIQIANVLKQSLIGVILLSFFRCAPLSSEMQSARLVGKHQVEITPGYSSIQFARSVNVEERKKESAGKLVGMQIAYGLSKKVDLRFRFEHVEYRELTANVYSFGPKVSLIKDRIALYVPLWFINNTPAQLQPTMLFTVPIVGNKIDFNPSVKSILSLAGYAPTTGMMVAFNAGFSISSDLSKWAIRPEYGIVYDVQQKARYTNFSIGLSMNLSRYFGK